MMRFWPAAAARLSTSVVARTVTAIPVTAVDGSPALKPSTVCDRQATPRLDRIRSATCCAVTVPRCARSTRGTSKDPAVVTMKSRLELAVIVRDCILNRTLREGPHELDYPHRQSP